MTSGAPGPVHRLADIQGLRAIAVLLVVLYHAGLPIPGGFIGVDVFFVISGFVITLLILREWGSDSGFSLRRFYLRRFKRLTPALAVLVIVVTVLAALILSPLGQQQTTAMTGAGALTLVANWVIVATSGNYFDDPATDNPLLNTWTLSVEEQFYLVVPALLLLALALGRRLLTPKRLAFVMLLAISFASVVIAALGFLGYGYQLGDFSWLVGFYSPFTRAWEFGAGALLAVAGRWPTSSRIGALLACLGLSLIVVGAFTITDSTPFPGPMTLLPVAGAVLVIAGNRSRAQFASNFLSTRPLVTLGDWSYSLYLWHWPLIVLAIALFPLNAPAPIVAAALSLVPAIASFKIIEDPMRRWRLPMSRARILALGGVWAAALAFCGLLWGSAQGGWLPQIVSASVRVRNPGDIDGTSTWIPTDSLYTNPCGAMPIMPPESGPDSATCRQSKPTGPIDVAIVGDSHAWELYAALAEALPRANVAWLDARGVPARSNPAAPPAFDYLMQHPAATVILATWWHYRGVPPDLSAAVNELAGVGSRVLVLDDFPSFPFEPEGCVVRPSPLAPAICDIPRATAEADLAAYDQALEDAVSNAGAGTVVKTFDSFCDETVCSMVHNGDLVYFDHTHLNFTGSKIVVDQLLRRYPEIAASSAGW